MASKYTKIERAINEFKSFLDYHYDEYRDAYRYIKPSEGWNIPYYSSELYQIPIELHGNLYEGIYPKLLPDNPATDEEIIASFKGCLKHFSSLSEVFNKIIEKRKRNNEEEILWMVEGTLNELLSKAIYKLKEVIQLAEEDLLRYKASQKAGISIKNNDKKNDNFLIGIITATTQEFNAVKSFLYKESMLPTQSDDSQIYYKGYFSKEDKRLNIILTQTHHQGIAAATNTTSKMILRFKPDIVVMLGHAAGNKNIHKKLNIGDILICSSSVDYEQVTYYETTQNPEIKKKSRKNQISADSTILKLVSDFCSSKKLAEIKESYKNSNKFDSPLQSKTGLLISGDALARSENWFKEIVGDNTGTIGLDMETYGFYYAAEHTLFKNKPYYISIKSVSDYGSHNTKYPDKIKDAEIRVDYAIYTSVKLFYEFALEHLPI